MTVSVKPLPFNAFNRKKKHRRMFLLKLKQVPIDEISETLTSLEKMGLISSSYMYCWMGILFLWVAYMLIFSIHVIYFKSSVTLGRSTLDFGCRVVNICLYCMGQVSYAEEDVHIVCKGKFQGELIENLLPIYIL